MVDKEYEFNLEEYILEKCVACRTPDQALKVVFIEESVVNFIKHSLEVKPLSSLHVYGNHGQEKCSGLRMPFSCTELRWVNVKKSLAVLQDDGTSCDKNIMELTLDTKEWPEFGWECGDTIGILPSNSEEDVTDLLNILGLLDKADLLCYFEAVSISKNKSMNLPLHIPKRTTPREILKDCLNIRGPLKKQFLRGLADFCAKDAERNFLISLSSKEGSEFYNDIILNRRFTLLDILKVCASCQPPLTLLVQHLPRLLPRSYSIANSPLETTAEFSIVFSVSGVTTKMLQKKPHRVLIYLRKPTLFRYTLDDFGSNQILIAIGTGVVPYLGFLQHKYFLQRQNPHSKAGETWLIVGSTTQQSIVHRDQLLQWQASNVLNKFIECHSRMLPPPKYRYVQDALTECSIEFVDFLIQPQTYLYICADGGAHISKSLEKAICECLCKELKITLNEADQIMTNYRRDNKYREDVWS